MKQEGKSSRTAGAKVFLLVWVVTALAVIGCKSSQAPTPAPTPAPAPSSAPSQGSAILEKKAEDLTVADMEKLQAVIETNQGAIKFKFFPEQAPNHCRNFIKLAQSGFYNGLIFHRVIKGFMIQGGDPQGTGSGGPGWNVNAEFSDLPHLKGTVSMARAQDPNSAGSQFFICLEAQPRLNGQYTVFGQVTSGQEVVDKIGATPTGPGDRPLEPQVMKKVSIEEIP